MEVRFLTRDDAAEWLRLRVQALRGDPEAFSASTEEYEFLDLDEVRRRLGLEGDAFVAGAFESGRMVGMAGFYREKGLKRRHKAHVWGVYVAPDARGQRVGRRLMETILARAAKIAGLEQVLLSVTTTQTAAVKLYQALGFEPFGREPRALKIGNCWIDEDYMILRLHPGNRPEKEKRP